MSPSIEKLIQTPGLEDYFRREIRLACEKQQIQTTPHTEFYLVQMLSKFCHRDSLFETHKTSETPLAILFLQSLEKGGIEGLKLLKHIGDFSLYISGFFQECLHRQKVDLGYYISMGGNAYYRLYSDSKDANFAEAFTETFLELSSHFIQFVDVLAEISENSNLLKDSDLLRLYEKWLATGSNRIQKKLNKFGIYPHLFSKQETSH
jgi:hypothetical protein